MKNKKGNKLAKNFLELVRKTYAEPITSIVCQVEDSQEIAFHRMHNVLLSRSLHKAKLQMEDSYPFVKVDSRWWISIPKMHIYLSASRGALASFENEYMQRCYSAVQNSMRYLEQARALDRKLTPMAVDGGYAEYQKALRELYTLHLMEQQALLIG